MAQQSLWEKWTSLLLDDAQAICWWIQVEGSPKRATWLIRQVRGGVYFCVDDKLLVLAGPPQLSGAGERWC